MAHLNVSISGEKMAGVVSRTGAWKLEIVKHSGAAGFEVLPKSFSFPDGISDPKVWS